MFIKYPFVGMFFLVCLCFCGRREKDEDIMIRMFNESFENTAKTIAFNSDNIYYDFYSKTKHPAFQEKASFYIQKIDSIKFQANSICNYVDSIKALKEINWENLNKYLNNSKKIFLNIDEDLSIEFGREINMLNVGLDSLINTESGFLDNRISPFNKIAILNKLFCDVKLLENKFIRFINSRLSVCCILNFDSYSTLVGQNVNHLREGEELIITGGVGAFSWAAKPIISIANKKIESINGQATYKAKVKGTVGKHTIPVRIEFMDESGKPQTKTITVEYTIDK